MKPKKRIMILGASILQLPAIVQAKQMGLEVITVDMDPNAIGFAQADISLVISTIDIPRVVEAARHYAVDGVMTLASDMPMRTVAAVSRELGLVGIDEQTAIKATNKAAMRQSLQEHQVPSPRFYKVANHDEYRQAVAGFDKPFIVKPADNSGSRGIYLIENLSDEKMIEEAYIYSHRFSRCGDVVVEEYMSGEEVSVETLTVNGECHVIQITDKITTGAPHFVEMGHSQPTHHSPEMVEKICQVAIAAGKAIGITNGPSHTEIMVTEDGPKIVELGARLGGDCITTHLVPLSTGVNMVECCIRIALGEQPDVLPKLVCGSAIRYVAQKAGVIRAIEGVAEAQQLPGVKQVSFTHQVGEKITEVDSSSARAGFVIAQGKDREEAIGICEDACKKIRIITE